MDRRVLFISPKSLFVSKYEQSAVAIVFDYASAELGLAPGLSLGVHMEPDEAVDLAQRLLQMVDDIRSSPSKR
jgi:hypothetical protein